MPHELIFFYSPGACSLAVHIALEEAGLTFDARRVTIADGAHRSPDYLDVNPRGLVPAMLVDGLVITEVQALLQLVSEMSLMPLAPDEPLGRSKVRELLALQSGGVHGAFAQIWRPGRFTSDQTAYPAIAVGGREALTVWFGAIEAAAAHGWMVADQFSIADLMPFVFFRWARRIGTHMGSHPMWERHSHRLLRRSAVIRAITREGLDPADWTRDLS